jgi:hypothetical protein
MIAVYTIVFLVYAHNRNNIGTANCTYPAFLRGRNSARYRRYCDESSDRRSTTHARYGLCYDDGVAVFHFGGRSDEPQLACLMFASLVGSAVASTAALGTLLIPMMAASGYNRANAAGLVACSEHRGTDPPSGPMIVYGVVASVSIKSLFLCGIAPVIYLTVGMRVVWFFVSLKDGVKTDTPNRHSAKPCTVFSRESGPCSCR